MNDLARIESVVCGVNHELTEDQVAAAIDALETLSVKVREWKRLLDDGLRDWLETNKRDLVIGSVRYYLAHPKETNCRSDKETLVSLLERFGPEYVAEQFLAARWFKAGAIKAELEPDEFARLFDVVEKVKVEEGKPRKQVQKIDERFVR
jgi:hypothetical protein